MPHQLYCGTQSSIAHWGVNSAGPCLRLGNGREAAGAGREADFGNWGEPLGLASLFIDGCVVALAIYRLVLIRPRRDP